MLITDTSSLWHCSDGIKDDDSEESSSKLDFFLCHQTENSLRRNVDGCTLDVKSNMITQQCLHVPMCTSRDTVCLRISVLQYCSLVHIPPVLKSIEFICIFMSQAFISALQISNYSFRICGSYLPGHFGSGSESYLPGHYGFGSRILLMSS